MTVLAAHRWPSNAHLIADVAKLGYITGHVLDLTHGNGGFWTHLDVEQLDSFEGADIDPTRSTTGNSTDFLQPPREWLRQWNTVVFDPPYKLNGRPDPTVDTRYGVHERTTLDQRLELISIGAIKAAHLVAPGGHLLVKVQDQVCSGRMWWLTDIVDNVIAHRRPSEFRKVDRFDLLGHHRPQPMEGRTQRTAHGRPSTLLVYRRERQ